MTCDAWPVVWGCDRKGTSPEIEAAALSAAQTLLWSRTGRRLGACTTTEKYRPPLAGWDCGRPYMTDDLVWHNGGGRGGNCCAIHLVSLPIVEVVEVKVWGEAVPADSYRVESAGRLVRRDACWPPGLECIDPPVEVTYRWGVPLIAPVIADPDAIPPVVAAEGSPLWGLVAGAMGEVAAEFVKGLCGQPCALPARLVAVSRQGVNQQFSSAAELLKEGLLGLPLADALIGTVNPGRLRSRSRVYSPDMAARA